MCDRIMKCFLSAILIFAVDCPTFAAAAESQPNIVFILIDDMGYGDLSCTGNRDVLTENIDRLAAEGSQRRATWPNRGKDQSTGFNGYANTRPLKR